MKQKLLAISIAFAALLSASKAGQTNQSSIGAEAYEKQIAAERIHSLEQTELFLIDSLGVRSAYGLKKFDSATIFYVRAFISQFMIRLESYPAMTHNFPDGETLEEGPFALLYVVERYDHQQERKSQEAAQHTITNIDTFYQEVTPHDFQVVKESIESAGFSRTEPIGPPSGCIDGNFYLIVLADSDSSRRAYRHVCDANYASDVRLAQPLFDFTLTHAPEASTRTDKVWREISNAHQD